MYDIVEKCADYDKIMEDALTGGWISFGFFVVAFLGAIVTLILWWRNIKDDAKQSDSDEAVKNVKKEKIKWCGALLLFVLLIGAGMSQSIKDISNASYDRKNQAYVIIDTDFRVTKVGEIGRWQNDVYTFTYVKDGKVIEFDSTSEWHNLSVGKHTNKIVVYAQKSGVILDVWEKNDG